MPAAGVILAPAEYALVLKREGRLLLVEPRAQVSVVLLSELAVGVVH